MSGMAKYVVVDKGSEGEQMFILPKTVNHDSFLTQGKPISAGFINFNTDDNALFGVSFHCFGESVTLKLKSRGEKDTLLANSLFTNGL